MIRNCIRLPFIKEYTIESVKIVFETILILNRVESVFWLKALCGVYTIQLLYQPVVPTGWPNSLINNCVV